MNRNILFIFVMVFVAGCATTEKKARNYYLENKQDLSALCAECFPVKSEFKPGKPIQLPADTVFIPGIPVIVKGDCPDGTKVDVECPPSDTIKVYIPIQIRDTLIQADSAAIFYWKGEHTKVVQDKQVIELKQVDLTESRNLWRKWALILGAAIAVFFIYKGYRFYAGGFLKR